MMAEFEKKLAEMIKLRVGEERERGERKLMER